jgi:hypothetical protein
MDQHTLEEDLHAWVLEHRTKSTDSKKLGKSLYEIFADEAKKKATQDTATLTTTENKA